MKSKKTIFFLYLFILSIGIFMWNPSTTTSIKQSNKKMDLVLSTTFNSPIQIDDFPSSLNNWSWAKSQGYCIGSGTQSDPYIIQNHIFNTSTISASCLEIYNSRKHFIVRNCFFIGSSSWAGIELYNVTNGVITKNSNKAYTGALVYMMNSSYISITNNNASYNSFYGIYLAASPGSISRNIISNNLIEKNNIYGIYIAADGYFNEISENRVLSNDFGIGFAVGNSNNTVTKNEIKNNLLGLVCDFSCDGNMINLNCFENNTLHALDLGSYNRWDDGFKGNYWDNYTGSDTDSNGIGDIPHNITGSAGSKDYFPLMACPFPSVAGIPGYSLPILTGTLFFMVTVGIYLAIKKQRFRLKK
ncbi:MAG: nitrous oxide reductase family maturation protein NosD [Promethearchaeota archaeon]